MAFIVSCAPDKSPNKILIGADNLDTQRENFNQQSKAIAKNLKGRQLSFLDSAIKSGSYPIGQTSLIFLGKKTDCASCTIKALEVLNSFADTELNRLTIKIGFSQVGGYNNNFDFVVNDEKAILQEQLGYFNTPALILYDKTGIISSYLIPSFEDSTALKNYVNSIYEVL